MAKIRGRAPKPAGVTVEDAPVPVGSVPHGLDRPLAALSSVDRLRRQLSLSDNCPIEQVMSDAATALERMGSA